MFETVVPEITQSRSRKVFYETLPVSIALHAIVVATCVVAAVWNVAFPTQSPRLLRPYSLVEIPEPPPPPPPPPRPQPVQAPPKVKAPPPPPLAMVHLDVAPTIIPDLVPKIEIPPPPPPPVATPPPPNAVPTLAASTEGVPDGVIGGKKHGVPGGIVFAEDGRVHVDRSEKLPLKEVEKDYPHYPDAARSRHLEDTCVVRYTIGKNGRVIDIVVIEHAKEPMFDEETISTVKKWRFRAMTVNGQPVEVVHEVEIDYQFIAR